MSEPIYNPNQFSGRFIDTLLAPVYDPMPEEVQRKLFCGLPGRDYERFRQTAERKIASGYLDPATIARALWPMAYDLGLSREKVEELASRFVKPYLEESTIKHKHSDECEPDCDLEVDVLMERLSIADAQRTVAEWDTELAGEPFTPLSSWEIDEPCEIVPEILIEGGITVFAGAPESYKSMAAIEICAAIRQQRKAFGNFETKQQLEVLYACADMSAAAFKRYASFFDLHQDPGFLGISPTFEGVPSLDDERLQAAVNGRVLVLDSLLDFAGIQEAAQSAEWITFFGKLRKLISVHGCKAILCIAHPNKTGAKSAGIDPADYFKDSVSFFGKIDIGFGFKREPNTSKIWVEPLKNGRHYEKSIKFTVTPHDEQGNSYLSQGRFPIVETPEQLAGQRIEDRAQKGGRKGGAAPEWVEQALELERKGASLQEIAETFGTTKGKVFHALKKSRKRIDEELPF